jgi:dephospho-CoA kinase
MEIIFSVFYSIYLTIIFICLTAVSIIMPRLRKNDMKKPMYIYMGFYILNTVFLKYFFKTSPFKSIIANFLMLVLAHFLAQKFKLYGLTGQISSGKSTVGKYLETRYKAVVIDIDKLNREVLEYEKVKNNIRKNFGQEVFLNDGSLNRQAMREIIFSDSKKRQTLERITHIEVFKSLIIRIFKEKFLYNAKYLFLENAILLRFPLLKLICFPILAVCTHNKAEVVRRIMERDNSPREVAENILNNQMKIEDFVQQADYVIFNDSNLDTLYKEVDEYFKLMNNN